MPLVRFRGRDLKLQVPTGTLLIDAIRRAGLPIARACGDDLICARCGVRVEGQVSSEKEVERRAKQRNRVDAELRLSCAVRIRGDLSVSADYWGPSEP